MAIVSRAPQRRSAWSARGRRIAAVPHVRTASGILLGLAALIETLVRASDAGTSQSYGLVLCLLALATTAPLAVLRRRPAALVVSIAALLSLAPFHSLSVAGLCAELAVLCRLSAGVSQGLAAALVLPFPVLALAGAAHGESRVLTLLLASLAPAAAWAGAAQRARNETAVRAAAQQLLVGNLLEHTARGERARIARELHDVVAHHISMIAVQAETARLTTAGMPPAGASRLAAIGDTARAALTEMRRLLGVLREDAETAVPDRQPQPGLSQLNELLDEARAASGTGSRLILRGPPDPLDPGVELAAYRIIQEALTNARRHAPGSAVDVELYYTDDTLELRIRDNGPGPPASPVPEGLGLLGMRERAAAVGGRLTTGPAAGGGFLVESVLPAKPEVAS